MQTSRDLVRIDRAGEVAEVVLDNPGQLNAMTPAFFHRIRDVFTELDADPGVRCILVWAEGRIFSSGLSLGDALGLVPGKDSGLSEAARHRALLEVITDFQDCFNRVRRARKPVLAAVHGWCIGGGLDLATACDLRVCTGDAGFAIQETKMAMVADLGTLQRITRLVGRGVAREMAFTGELLPAQRALACGLVNEVYPDKERMLEGARALARTIAGNSPLAVEGIKRVLDHAEEHGEQEGLDFVARWNTSFFLSDDLFEALQAFTEKRDPRFRGS